MNWSERITTANHCVTISPFVLWPLAHLKNPGGTNSQYKQLTLRYTQAQADMMEWITEGKRWRLVSRWLFGKHTGVMVRESKGDVTALASLWHNADNWNIRLGRSTADVQLITTSPTAHRPGSFSGACSKWSEASDSRQTLPNAVRGASQRVCWNTVMRWRPHSCSRLGAHHTCTNKGKETLPTRFNSSSLKNSHVFMVTASSSTWEFCF